MISTTDDIKFLIGEADLLLVTIPVSAEAAALPFSIETGAEVCICSEARPGSASFAGELSGVSSSADSITVVRQ